MLAGIKSFFATTFRDYIDTLKDKQKRMNKYNILDVVKVQLRSLRDGSKKVEEFSRHPILRYASTGNISYWTSKIIDYDVYHQVFKKAITPEANLHGRSIAIDGTVISLHMKNSLGLNKASVTVCSLLDMNKGTFIDYNIAENCNEHDGLKQQMHLLTRNDVLVGDRNYGKPGLMGYLYDSVKFIFRVSHSLTMSKKFLKLNKRSAIVTYEDKKYKFIRYRVNKLTRNIVSEHHRNAGNATQEDETTSEFLLCINDLTIANDDAIKLYKGRWKIETKFKLLKSNFDIREPVKASNCKNPSKQINYNVGMSFALFNMTVDLQNESIVSDGRKPRFSRCASEVRNLCDKAIYGLLDDIVFSDLMIRLMRHLSNKPDIRQHGCRNHKRGRYKSKYRIECLNIESQ